MEITHTYCDVDGVLCDFVGGALAAHGYPRIDAPRITRYDMWECLGMTEYSFWEPLDWTDFWASLDPLCDMGAVLLLLESFTAPRNVTLLTSPRPTPASHAGKYDWIRAHLPRYAEQGRYCLTPNKAALAGPGRLLVDDSDSNVKAWRDAGGLAILFPAPWNARRELALTGRQLETLGADLRRLELMTAYLDD